MSPPDAGTYSRPPRLLQRAAHFLAWLFPPNFITFHYAYYIFTVLLSSVILWGASTPSHSASVRYIDALFLCVSAMTLSGLNTVDLSSLNTFQQVILFLLTIIGSPVLVSWVVVAIRKKAFEKRFKSIVESQKRAAVAAAAAAEEEEACAAQSDNTADGGHDVNVPTDSVTATAISTPVLSHDHDDIKHQPPTTTSSPFDLSDDKYAYAAYPAPSNASYLKNRAEYGLSVLSEGIQGLVGRNSAFYGLTAEDRRKLGGVEYRALRFLVVIVPLYSFSFQFLGAIGLGAWIAKHRPEVAYANSLHPWWVGIFNAISAFNNNGMSLLDANVTVFQTCPYVLLTMGFLILAGHTCFPVFLRLIIWSWSKLIRNKPRYHDLKVTLQFLLDHPRRCYTHLFPAAHTWFLVGALVLVNGIDWSMFEVLNIGNDKIGHMSRGTKVLDGLFQAIAVRSGGFYVVPMSDLRLSMLVLYVLMMYVSVYPVVITMRNSNVYEERSLGLFPDFASKRSRTITAYRRIRRSFRKSSTSSGRRRSAATTGTDISNDNGATRPPSVFSERTIDNDADAYNDTTNPDESRAYFIRHQIHSQLAHDLWWVSLAVLLVTIVETTHVDRDPITYSVFNIIFELISGYGCVGVSTGLPGKNYSFSGGWHTLSKLIICAVMIRGRHRGLPAAIDRAICLPGEHLAVAEEEDQLRRLETRGHAHAHAHAHGDAGTIV